MNSAPHVVLHGAICGPFLEYLCTLLQSVPNVLLLQLMLGHTRLHFCNDAPSNGHNW